MAKSDLLAVLDPEPQPKHSIWAGVLLEGKLTLWHLLLCWTLDIGKRKGWWQHEQILKARREGHVEYMCRFHHCSSVLSPSLSCFLLLLSSPFVPFQLNLILSHTSLLSLKFSHYLLPPSPPPFLNLSPKSWILLFPPFGPNPPLCPRLIISVH